MKKTTVAWLLKAVLILARAALLVAAGNLLPMYMNHVRRSGRSFPAGMDG